MLRVFLLGACLCSLWVSLLLAIFASGKKAGAWAPRSGFSGLKNYSVSARRNAAERLAIDFARGRRIIQKLEN